MKRTGNISGRSIRIAPSILSADFSMLGRECEAVEDAGCDLVHVDVMDGHFVPNISMGPSICASIRPYIKTEMDVHLMVSPVDDVINSFIDAGADILTVHIEAGPHIHRTCQKIRARNVKAGIALNPGSPASMIVEYLDSVDLICVMTVNPGFSGQSFIDSQLEKISTLSQMVAGRDIILEIDGGVTSANARKIVQAGGDILVAGTSVFGCESGCHVEKYRTNILEIRQQAEIGLQG